MTTRDIVLLGTGAFVGFFIMGYFNKTKQPSQEEIYQPLQSVDQAKLASCIKSAEEKMQVIKLSGDVDLDVYKQKLIDDCMQVGI